MPGPNVDIEYDAVIKPARIKNILKMLVVTKVINLARNMYFLSPLSR